MSLDLLTAHIFGSMIVLTCGLMFIIDTLRRQAEGAARIWSLAFLAGMLTVVCYTSTVLAPDAWWMLAAGNASFVAAPGLFWIGACRFNARPMRVPALVVGGAVLFAFGAVPMDLQQEAWAGSRALFALVTVLCVLVVIETRRGALRSSPYAAGVAVALGVQGAFTLVRLVIFVLHGPESALFQEVTGAAIASVVLGAVSIVTSAMLLAIQVEERSAVTGHWAENLGIAHDGVIARGGVFRLATDALERAKQKHESAAVISVRIETLARVASAFGAEEATSLREVWRAAVRDRLPTEAFLGEDGDDALIAVIAPCSSARLRSVTGGIERGIMDAFVDAGTSVLPIVLLGTAVVTPTETSNTDEVFAAARSNAHEVDYA